MLKACQKYLIISVLIFLSFIISANAMASEKTLNVTMSLAEDEWKVMRTKIFPGFEQKHKCTIKASEVAAGDLPKLLEASKMAGRSTVDVFSQDNMQLAALVEKGLVMDLSREEKKLSKKIIKSLVEAGRFGGKLYFLPYRPNVQIMYYNEKAFNKHGLKAPKTWDELLDAAKRFKEKEKIGKFLIKGFGGAPTVTQMYEFIVAAGGDPFTFNDEGSTKTFEFMKKLWRYSSPDSRKAKWDTSNDYFARESAYLMQNWPFGYKIIVDKYKKKSVKVYSGVKGPKREAHVIGGEVLGIPASTGNKKLALKFIRYMQSKKIQNTLVKELAWPSIRTDAYEDIPENMKDPFNAIKAALEKGIFRKNAPYWSEFEKLFNEAFTRIVIKQQDTKSVLNEYHGKIEKVKEQYETKE